MIAVWQFLLYKVSLFTKDVNRRYIAGQCRSMPVNYHGRAIPCKCTQNQQQVSYVKSSNSKDYLAYHVKHKQILELVPEKAQIIRKKVSKKLKMKLQVSFWQKKLHSANKFISC